MVGQAVAVLCGGDGHGDPFTVDGLNLSLSGVFSDIGETNTLSDSGFEPSGSGSLLVPVNTRWLPKVGQLVNIRAMQYRISAITNDPTHYRLSLALPNS